MWEGSNRLALVLTIVAFIPYILGIFGRGLWGGELEERIRPSIISWEIWLALDLLILVGMIVKGTVTGLMIGATLGAMGVLLVAVWQDGRILWTGWDKFSLYGVGAAAGFWYLNQTPDAGIAACVATLTVGTLPGLKDASKNGTATAGFCWMIWFAAATAGFMAIAPLHDISATIQPIAFAGVALGMMVLNFTADLK